MKAEKRTKADLSEAQLSASQQTFLTFAAASSPLSQEVKSAAKLALDLPVPANKDRFGTSSQRAREGEKSHEPSKVSETLKVSGGAAEHPSRRSRISTESNAAPTFS